MGSRLIKTYSEMLTYGTFEDRLHYLQVFSTVGSPTFGFDSNVRYRFLKSKEWRDMRKYIITRDLGCDMALSGFEITNDKIFIHHINPIDIKDIIDCTELLLNPENLVLVSFDTHQMIHYGDRNVYDKHKIVERTPNDTCPWL